MQSRKFTSGFVASVSAVALSAVFTLSTLAAPVATSSGSTKVVDSSTSTAVTSTVAKPTSTPAPVVTPVTTPAPAVTPAPAATSTASATPAVSVTSSMQANLIGAPNIVQSSPLGYYIWYGTTDDRLHVATHGPGDEHEFVATLQTSGLFENIDTAKLESGDSYQLLDGGHTLMLDFHTYQYTDDIAFTVAGAPTMSLNLQLDGSPIDTGLIYIGPSGSNPATNPFSLDV